MTVAMPVYMSAKIRIPWISIMIRILSTSILLVSIAAVSAQDDGILTHFVSYQNRGTRSELRIGSLSVHGYRIPYVFDHVITKDESYKNIIRYAPFGNHGYFPAAKEEIRLFETQTPFTEKDRERGFYLSAQNHFSGTPKTWIYVQWNGSGAFVDTSRIESVMNQKPFSDLKPKGPLKYTPAEKPGPAAVDPDVSNKD